MSISQWVHVEEGGDLLFTSLPSDLLNDSVSRFLLARGHKPVPYTFEGSDWVIGCQVEFSGMRIVYNVVGDTVVVGEISACSGATREEMMRVFITFVRTLSCVPGLKRVKGMVLAIGADPKTRAERKRLAALLELHGTHWAEEDGERWLIYPLRRDEVSRR